MEENSDLCWCHFLVGIHSSCMCILVSKISNCLFHRHKIFFFLTQNYARLIPYRSCGEQYFSINKKHVLPRFYLRIWFRKISWDVILLQLTTLDAAFCFKCCKIANKIYRVTVFDSYFLSSRSICRIYRLGCWRARSTTHPALSRL